MQKPKMQVVVTFEHRGRKITATRFAVDGMITNPIPDSDVKRRSLEHALVPLRQRREIIEAEITYLDAQERLTAHETHRRELAPSESEAVTGRIRELEWELKTYEQFVPLSRFNTSTSSWRAITPKPKPAVQAHRPAA